ncbi:hypothetical protein PV08_09860 [Exophiala spinifera]|uniref:Uncharacterized protein n=1 Tax=Exophiala spinifera TaxID=91928 RepID=A0A0D1ZI86_9EURO|nr:uncharacterized protein PV08_09860 [Exophiala spinifera]KIW12582.1 hypothetical protein PV08_09860 [Exophiala spinifera]
MGEPWEFKYYPLFIGAFRQEGCDGTAPQMFQDVISIEVGSTTPEEVKKNIACCLNAIAAPLDTDDPCAKRSEILTKVAANAFLAVIAPVQDFPSKARFAVDAMCLLRQFRDHEVRLSGKKSDAWWCRFGNTALMIKECFVSARLEEDGYLEKILFQRIKIAP